MYNYVNIFCNKYLYMTDFIKSDFELDDWWIISSDRVNSLDNEYDKDNSDELILPKTNILADDIIRIATCIHIPNSDKISEPSPELIERLKRFTQ